MNTTTMKRKRWGVIDPTSTIHRSTPPPPTTGPISQPTSIQASAEAALSAVLPKFGPHNLPPPPAKRPRSDGEYYATVLHPQFSDKTASMPLHHDNEIQTPPQTAPAKSIMPPQQATQRTNFDSKEAALKMLQRRKRLEAWKEMMRGSHNNREADDGINLDDGAANGAHSESCSASTDSERTDQATDATIVARGQAEKSNDNVESSNISHVQQKGAQQNQSKLSPETTQRSNLSSSSLPPSDSTLPSKQNAITSIISAPNKSPPSNGTPLEGSIRSNDTNHMETDQSSKTTFGRESLNLSGSEKSHYDEKGVVKKLETAAASAKSEEKITSQNVDSIRDKQPANEKEMITHQEGNEIKKYASSLLNKLRVLEEKVAAAATSPEDGNTASVVKPTGVKTHSELAKQIESIEQKAAPESPLKAGVSQVGKELNNKTHIKAAKQKGTKKKSTSGRKKSSLFRHRLAIPVATPPNTTATAIASTGNTQSNSEAPSIVSATQMKDSMQPLMSKKSRKTTNNRKKSNTKSASLTQAPAKSLWDYDYNPSESSDSEGDHGFLLRSNVDILGDGEMIWSKPLPRKVQNDSTGKGDDILRSRISSVQDQIRKADALIQSTAPSYLEYKSKGWVEVGYSPTTAIGEGCKLVPVPPSEKLHASSHTAQEYLSILKSAALKAYNNSNPLANDKVMEFLTIIKDSRNNSCGNSSITNPYQLMKRVWRLIQSIVCNICQNDEKDLLASELAMKFDPFLPHGYSMLSQNYIWHKRNCSDEEKKDLVFVESCARTYLAFSTVENSGDVGRL